MEDRFKQYQGLIELTKTTEDVVKLDEEIDLLTQTIYHVDKSMFDETLERQVRIRVATEMRRLIQLHAEFKKEELRTFLSNAYRTISALPILQLTMAFEPSESVINTISHFARQNITSGILLDLSLDRSILGGAVIMYHGKFYDFSLKKKINDIFKKGNLTLG